MTFHVQAIWGLVVSVVAVAAQAETTVGADLAGFTAENTVWMPSGDFHLYPMAPEETEPDPNRWEGVHRQVATMLTLHHLSDRGWNIGLRLAHVYGEPVNTSDRPRTIRDPEGDLSFPAVVDRSYTLFGAGAFGGYRGQHVGVEAGLGLIMGPESTTLPTVGVRLLAGRLVDNDAPGIWGEMSIGTVDSLPVMSQFSLAAALKVDWFTARVGLEASNLPVYDAAFCDDCLVAQADGGGPFLDLTGHVGPVNVHVRGVLREDSWGQVGLGYVF